MLWYVGGCANDACCCCCWLAAAENEWGAFCDTGVRGWLGVLAPETEFEAE